MEALGDRTVDEAEPRPADLAAYSSRYGKPRGALRWLDPKVLLSSARLVALSGLFSRFADKRETEAAAPAPIFDASEAVSEAGGYFDFVSDVGDGFGATYAVASAIAQDHLELTDSKGTVHRTHRGGVLLMGGDEVYPYAEFDSYRARTIGPYTAALPPRKGERAPAAFALPGNHDWYDGLTAFMRVFCSGAWFGGWRTRQRRSYFALKLRDGLWLWAIDSQFDTYLDAAQLEHFRTAGGALEEGDAVILATAKPSWVHVEDGKEAPQSWQTLAFVEEKLIRPRGRLLVTLTGDAHHYARYEYDPGDGPKLQKLTAGGGGAALSSTHGLPGSVDLPTYAENTGLRPDRHTFKREAAWPKPADSKKLMRAAFAGPPLVVRMPLFALLVAGLYGVIGWLAAAGIKDEPAELNPERDASVGALVDNLGDLWRFSSFAAVALLTIGLVAFARPGDRKPDKWTKLKRGAGGFAHALAHLMPLLVVSAIVVMVLANPGWWTQEHGVWAILATGIVAATFGFVWGPLVLLTYMYWANRQSRGHRFGTELDAALSDREGRGYKNFLRLHVDPEGERLTILPVGLRDTPAHDEWKMAAAGSRQWFEAESGLSEPELIEDPIVVELK